MDQGVIYDVVPRVGGWPAVGYILDGQYYVIRDGKTSHAGQVEGEKFTEWDSGGSGTVKGLVLERDGECPVPGGNLFDLVPRT